jgi:hypothetical protein
MGNSSVRPAEGPLSHPNWRAAAQGEPLRSVWETPLHSDVRIFGDIREGLGPYALIHALPADQRDPVFILRVRSHLDGGLPSLSKTRLENFTGSSLADEVAALIALELGVRLAAGSATRSLIRDNEWQISGDGARPAFLPRRADGSRVLPNVFGDKNCGPGLLTSYSALPGSVATSLVRAARSYRDALWVAEVEPELAWLLLVSALEVAAVQQQVHRTAPGALLAEVKPDLVARLEPDVAAIVAQAFERELAATRRFLDFMDAFMPSPPSQRPDGRLRLDWSPENLRRCMVKVYGHRSRALHEAIPFPPPLCDPPMVVANSTAETTVFVAAARTGGVCVEDDLPFPLNTFEYIARGALLRWWTKLATSSTTMPTNLE